MSGASREELADAAALVEEAERLLAALGPEPSEAPSTVEGALRALARDGPAAHAFAARVMCAALTAQPEPEPQQAQPHPPQPQQQPTTAAASATREPTAAAERPPATPAAAGHTGEDGSANGDGNEIRQPRGPFAEPDRATRGTLNHMEKLGVKDDRLMSQSLEVTSIVPVGAPQAPPSTLPALDQVLGGKHSSRQEIMI